MVYAEFAGCLSWPATADAGVDSLEFLPEEIETFGKCGLDLKRYTLSASFAPRFLGMDIDGDDAHNYIEAWWSLSFRLRIARAVRRATEAQYAERR